MQMDPNLAASLKTILKNHGFIFSEVPYAFYRASRDGGHLTFYHSGKVLVQGKAHTIETIHLILDKITPQNGETILGLDESGKGDFFGPLVLAGAIIKPEQESELRKAGINDSKTMDDNKIARLFLELNQKFIWKVRIILPKEYNQLYSHWGNLNLLMVDEYKKLIHDLSSQSHEAIILDRFSASSAQNADITRSTNRKITIEPKAEKHIPVAAASIVARYHFSQWFTRENKDLPKGSGPAAKELFLKKRESLQTGEFEKIAKTHFLSKQESLF